jgi:L-threonylcarbamoyladenylate synthase
LFDVAVQRAAELLRAGELVALPTETVYGLAANAFDENAVAKIFQVKGRPATNPIIVHVSDVAMAKRCARDWPTTADQLSVAFWPGPLTLVLPRSKNIPDNVTAGGDTVGIRWPSHPFIQAVIRACDFPLAAPSANLSNSISPTNAEHVRKGLGDQIPLIVDGGQSQVGIESTVIDLTSRPCRLLRPGMIHEESLLAVVRELTLGFGDSEQVLKSPGLLRKHYSPKAKLRILNWQNESDLEKQAASFLSGLDRRRVQVIAHTRIPLSQGWGRVSVIPHDAEAFARAIYSELHHCDETGAEMILVEGLPSTPEWRAIADRLSRAVAEEA